MFRLTSLSASIVALTQIANVAGHGGVLLYEIGSTWYNGFVPYNTPVGQSTIQREWDSYNPITDPTDAQLSCNIDGANLGSGQLSATVAAGTQVTAFWNQWPHTIGPVMVYMASCGGSCTSANTADLNWFKIEQAGLISGALPTGTWAMGELVANNNSWTTNIPSSLAPGEYFIRHELLAIHTANQPQFYPECAQLIVTGSGTATPSSEYLVKLPGAYSMSDPGVNIDIYNEPTVTNYTIPGPAVWPGN
ncbi:glycoside hydrolase family 61 protein [Serpula lacrymans var. lacrymans S7.3]|uniref:AA9 family lytic polysaccharide monooxygenase n=2 Tax=Serpula lacrymans var. lacrymans TaxID=341189 RepID=F8PW30_SERL3|nr:glycoside hydrolase family 61 protein [Serpula lacrymans var. lacrymans S7.9]EGN99889.1 glycoside hydrolase family 61 protein [Serpula lacrymans var. lacrymans S7.3]EGO25457.1 glycoside hydrolase family 61 protein [Serpula lacrymans var. lacrymans S7.9]